VARLRSPVRRPREVYAGARAGPRRQDDRQRPRGQGPHRGPGRHDRLPRVVRRDLRFLLIVSAVELATGPGLAVTVERARAGSGERCWNFTGDVAATAAWPGPVRAARVPGAHEPGGRAGGAARLLRRAAVGRRRAAIRRPKGSPTPSSGAAPRSRSFRVSSTSRTRATAEVCSGFFANLPDPCGGSSSPASRSWRFSGSACSSPRPASATGGPRSGSRRCWAAPPET